VVTHRSFLPADEKPSANHTAVSEVGGFEAAAGQGEAVSSFLGGGGFDEEEEVGVGGDGQLAEGEVEVARDGVADVAGTWGAGGDFVAGPEVGELGAELA
jgi:hypothetical protein